MLNHVRLFATSQTVVHQALLSMEFSRQQYWIKLPFPPPGNLPTPGIESASLVTPALAGGFFITAPPGKPTFPVLCLIDPKSRKVLTELGSYLEAVRKNPLPRLIQAVGRIQFLALVGLRSHFLAGCWLRGQFQM